MKEENNVLTFKLITLGSSGVGKSTILQKYCHSSPAEGGCELVKKLHLDGRIVRLQISETNQQSSNIVQPCYSGADGAVIVFDLTKEKSFLDVSKYLEDVRKYCTPDAPIVLIGNKSDLTSQRKINSQEIQHLVTNTHDLVRFIETNAQSDAIKIEETFLYLAHYLTEERKQVNEELKRQNIKKYVTITIIAAFSLVCLGVILMWMKFWLD